jgi:hypothetical protein
VSLNQTDLGFSLSGVTLRTKQLFQKECVGILTIFEKPLRMRYIFIAGLLLTLLTSSGFAQVRDECSRHYSVESTYSGSGNGLDPENTSIGHHQNDNLFTPTDDTEMGTIEMCHHLRDTGTQLANRPQNYYKKQGYDTLKTFMESCAKVFSDSWHSFNDLDGCVTEMDTANIRWLEYREWLKKVLYLSDDSMYYCSDFNSMILTFVYLVPGKGVDYNGGVALIDYILEHNRCPDQTAYWLDQRKATRSHQVQIWQDTVTNSELTPLDTSVVSIDSIGFSILKGPQFGAVKAHSPNTTSFGELRASKNPFTDETTLETTITDAMMLRLEVFDVLGKQLYAENEFLLAGDVKWRLTGKSLPRGVIYVRISTIGGIVKTIKLAKE